MLHYPELTMPRSRTVTTVCNGRREGWTDYEEAKEHFLEMMMTTEVEKRDRAECVYIQLIHGLDECLDEDEQQHWRILLRQGPFCYAHRWNGNAYYSHQRL